MRALLLAAAGLFALHASPLLAQGDSSITARIAAAPSEAQTRIARAMMAEGLAVAGPTTVGMVVAQGTEKGNSIDVRYTAVILPVDSMSEVTLTAIATAKAQFAGTRVERRVTSKLKGARDVWARLQRIAAEASK
jgi:hypothetical protein